MDKKGFIKGTLEKYPEKLLSRRPGIEANVASCLVKDPTLIYDSNLTRSYFVTTDGRFLFDLVKRLTDQKVENIDLGSVYAHLDGEALERFKSLGNKNGVSGMKFIELMKNTVNLDNWPTFLDQLKRENMLLSAYDKQILPMNSMRYGDRVIDPVSEFHKMTCSEVIDFYETILDGFEDRSSSGVIQRTKIDFSDDWLERIEQGAQNGIPFDYSFEDIEGQNSRVYPILSQKLLGLLPKTTTLIGGFSSTGKSTFLVGIIMALVFNGYKVLFLGNEEDADRFMQKAMVWIIHNVFREDCVTKRQLAMGKVSPEGRKLIEKARRFWNDNGFADCIQYVHIEPKMENVLSEMRAASRNGFNVVFYDTFKIQSKDMKNSRQDLALVEDSRALDAAAKKYNMAVVCTVQLAESMKNRLWANSSLLSNSKQMKETQENVLLIRPVYKEELDPTDEKLYIRPFELVETDGIVTRKPVEIDPEGIWKVLFIEKSRGGANSDDTGTAILYRFDGDYSTFVEYCLCMPRHGTLQ